MEVRRNRHRKHQIEHDAIRGMMLYGNTLSTQDTSITWECNHINTTRQYTRASCLTTRQLQKSEHTAVVSCKAQWNNQVQGGDEQKHQKHHSTMAQSVSVSFQGQRIAAESQPPGIPSGVAPPLQYVRRSQHEGVVPLERNSHPTRAQDTTVVPGEGTRPVQLAKVSVPAHRTGNVTPRNGNHPCKTARGRDIETGGQGVPPAVEPAIACSYGFS